MGSSREELNSKVSGLRSCLEKVKHRSKDGVLTVEEMQEIRSLFDRTIYFGKSIAGSYTLDLAAYTNSGLYAVTKVCDDYINDFFDNIINKLLSSDKEIKKGLQSIKDISTTLIMRYALSNSLWFETMRKTKAPEIKENASFSFAQGPIADGTCKSIYIQFKEDGKPSNIYDTYTSYPSEFLAVGEEKKVGAENLSDSEKNFILNALVSCFIESGSYHIDDFYEQMSALICYGGKLNVGIKSKTGIELNKLIAKRTEVVKFIEGINKKAEKRGELITKIDGMLTNRDKGRSVVVNNFNVESTFWLEGTKGTDVFVPVIDGGYDILRKTSSGLLEPIHWSKDIEYVKR